MYRYRAECSKTRQKEKRKIMECIAIKGVDMAHQNIQTQFDE